MIRKVVIPVAGLGTRLLPATKEQPKEMLPVFARADNEQLVVKPLVQLIFEQLHDYGLREFCFVVGRGKRAIEDHLTQDHSYVEMLKNRSRDLEVRELETLYARLESSTTIWVNQSRPKGFGDAVLRAHRFTGDEDFMVHAGDTYVSSQGSSHLNRLLEAHLRLKADATFIVKKTRNPEQYGVIEFEWKKEHEYKVKKVIEKPQKPPSNVAVVAIYIFRPVIFTALQDISPGKDEEIQLTDAIQKLIDSGFSVCAVELKPEEVRLDIGSPELYWEALNLSHQYVHAHAPK
jgi:UTP--glucose-1-phosphate uridylyltransferase